MATTTIQPGTALLVTDAFGEDHHAEALTGIEEAGHDFPVVWVNVNGERIPWPVESVRPT